MCGLFGLIAPEPASEQLVDRIHALQAHRGPNDRGTWRGRLDKSHFTLLVQRLAIIDLTSNGSQPFRSHTTGSVLAFNGEIYNYLELRQELTTLGIEFHTSTDTEVLLAALDHYGIEKALEKLSGMFAFAWLCGRSNRLWLARDRVGEKPLYWWREGRCFAFASEIKSLLAVAPKHSLAPNDKVIRNFLVDGLVDYSEETFFSGIYSLRPSQYAEIIENDGTLDLLAHNYWPTRFPLTGARTTLAENAERCLELVSEAVRIRLRSDVPVGFLLSGGIDSSIVTALALKHGVDRSRCKAFSIVNPHIDADETRWIDAAALHLGIQVQKITYDPTGEELFQQLESYVSFHDEPFTGLSILAHVEIMKAARAQGVTVLLSGQGADELFCGYNKYLYFQLQALLRQRRPVRAMQLAWNFLKNGTVFQSFSAADAARYINIPLPGVSRLPLGKRLVAFDSIEIGLKTEDIRERQVADLLRFSAPAINHVEDRTSMSLSREVRCPFFDPNVMNFALSLSSDQKVGGGWTKRVLRLAAQHLLPPQITWRKDKVGHFTAPEKWLAKRGSNVLRCRIDRSSPVFSRGFLDADRMMPLWNAFWSGSQSGLSVRQVVSILTLDVWLRTFAPCWRP